MSKDLMAVEVDVVPFDQCKRAYDYSKFGFISHYTIILTIDFCDYLVSRPLTDRMFCAGRNNGKGVCQGDSGGPLTYNGQLIGIVSWGKGCADRYLAAVYTNVPYFINWIIDNIALRS